MKHIGIDARLLFQTGVGTYLQNLLHNLSVFTPADVEFTIYCLPEDVSFIQREVPESRIHTTHARWHSFKEQTEFLLCVQKDSLDLMHFTYFGYPILYRRPYISTIHDLTPLLFKTGKASTKNPFLYGLKHSVFLFMLNNQIRQSKAIITPTHTVKEQLVLHYGKAIGEKITPIYEGVSYRLIESREESNKLEKPYLLYVGNFYPHKNVKFLIRAFAKSGSSRTLVLAGPHDFFLQRILSTLSEEEKRHIIIREKQSLGQLVTLYHHAEALIHPSVSEGFGLPIVEAMHFGLPVIASHIPVFQELLGTSHYSFDPYEESSIINAIQLFENETEKKKNNLNKEFSFKEMTRRTVEVYLQHV